MEIFQKNVSCSNNELLKLFLGSPNAPTKLGLELLSMSNDEISTQVVSTLQKPSMDIINLGEIIRQIKPSEAVIQQSQTKLINSIQDWKKNAIIFSATSNNKSWIEKQNKNFNISPVRPISNNFQNENEKCWPFVGIKKLNNEKEVLSQREMPFNVNKSESRSNTKNYQNVPFDYFKDKKSYFSGNQIPGVNILPKVSSYSRHPNTHDGNNRFTQPNNKKFDSCEPPYFFNPNSKNMYNSHELLSSVNLGELQNVRSSFKKAHEETDKMNQSSIPSLSTYDEHDKTDLIRHSSNSDIQDPNVFCRGLETPVQRLCTPGEKIAQRSRCPPAPVSSPLDESKATKERNTENCCDALTLLNAVVRSLTKYPNDTSKKTNTMHNDLEEAQMLHQEQENGTSPTPYNMVKVKCANVPPFQEENNLEKENVQCKDKDVAKEKDTRSYADKEIFQKQTAYSDTIIFDTEGSTQASSKRYSIFTCDSPSFRPSLLSQMDPSNENLNSDSRETHGKSKLFWNVKDLLFDNTLDIESCDGYNALQKLYSAALLLNIVDSRDIPINSKEVDYLSTRLCRAVVSLAWAIVFDDTHADKSNEWQMTPIKGNEKILEEKQGLGCIKQHISDALPDELHQSASIVEKINSLSTDASCYIQDHWNKRLSQLKDMNEQNVEEFFQHYLNFLPHKLAASNYMLTMKIISKLDLELLGNCQKEENEIDFRKIRQMLFQRVSDVLCYT